MRGRGECPIDQYLRETGNGCGKAVDGINELGYRGAEVVKARCRERSIAVAAISTICQLICTFLWSGRSVGGI